MYKNSNILILVLFMISSTAYADDEKAHLITNSPIKVNGVNSTIEAIGGLINMDEISTDPLDNCTQFIQQVKVAGVQFSPSSTTLESFRYIHKDVQWVVQTNMELLSNVGRSEASNWIRVGRKYLVHFQSCGSGNFTSLINMYSIN